MAFRAYLDCSGSARDPQSRVMTVGGYIATDSQWQDFEGKWAIVLRNFGVSSLHMNDYAHSTKGSEFESWRGDEGKRREFMEALTLVIVECDLQSVSVTLPRNAFDEVDREFQLREELGSPYAAVTLRAIAQVYKWYGRRDGLNERLVIVIEHGDNDQATFNRAFDRIAAGRVNDLPTRPIFQKKKSLSPSGQTVYSIPFQAADLLCYEHAKMFTDWLTKGKKLVRESLFRVSFPWKEHHDEDAHQWMEENSMRALSQILGVRRRDTSGGLGV